METLDIVSIFAYEGGLDHDLLDMVSSLDWGVSYGELALVCFAW